MELGTAVELSSQSAEPFQPTVEARFKLCPRRYGHPYATQGGHRLHEAGEEYLTVETVVETLYELSLETRVGVGMYVHTHDDFRTTKLPEGMLDAIGDVCC